MTWHSNTTGQRPNFVSHLECSATGERHAAGQLHNLSRAGFPLLVRYDLERMAAEFTRDSLAGRAGDLWRYREMLPVTDVANIVSLGEITTPMVSLRATARHLGSGRLDVKDEGRLPTGSFKARGIAVAISMARELGVTSVAMPTNGNAGAALSGYATRAGIASLVFCPEDTPPINIAETGIQGARLYRVNGLINDCGKIVGDGQHATGWFDLSTLKEPYRIEGKKTMGLELCEQLDWTVPDVIFYPTGGGTGLIGMWKAFDELGRLGWLDAKRPRMVAVQAEGCAPIVKAFDEGQANAEPWQNASTVAAGIRVPVAIGDFLILDAVRASGGFAIAVSDAAIEAARAEVASRDGLLLCPEGAATYAAWLRSLDAGLIERNDHVVLFNCATGLKYPLPDAGTPLDCHAPIDYDAIAAGSDVTPRD